MKRMSRLLARLSAGNDQNLISMIQIIHFYSYDPGIPTSHTIQPLVICDSGNLKRDYSALGMLGYGENPVNLLIGLLNQ